MIIARLELLNFKCFKGCHQLELGPGTYALLAEIEDDGARSNGGGKSSLVSAIRFALYGARSSQDLVSWGESKMQVCLHLSTGVTVKRGWDQKGWVEVTGAEDARRKDADQHIAELVGFSSDDFSATCFLGGGDAGRLAQAGPAERRDLLAAWVVPPMWGTLAERAQAKLRQAEAALQQARSKLAAHVPQDVTVLGQARAALAAQLHALRPAPPELQRAALTTQLGASGYLKRLAEYGRLLEQALPPPPQGNLQSLELEAGVVRMDEAMSRQRLAELEQLALGQFQGPCPVDGVLCPRAAEIRQGALLHRGKLQRARQQANELSAALREREGRVDAYKTALAARGKAIAEIRDAEAALVTPALYTAAHRAALRADPAAERDRLARQVGQLDAQIDRANRDAQATQELGRSAAALEVQVAAWRWMLRAAGRDGVPAMLVDEAAQIIAEEATGALGAAGGLLEVRFRTEEPLKKLASHCAACAREFPPRAKTCACGAARGPQLVPDLSVLVRRGGEPECPLDLRSSGEGDVVALGLRLGAAAYRRRLSGAPFAALVLDEVDAHMDGAHTAMLAELVHRGAAQLGFEQVFCSSHRPDFGRAAQRTIRVRQRGGWSEVAID